MATFWRVHPGNRPFGPADATSKPFYNHDDAEPQQGYSCFESPWHLYFYVLVQWSRIGDENTVLTFPGTRVGTGHDGEDLAVPTGPPRKTTWGRFCEDLPNHPLPANPKFAPWMPHWYQSWDALAKRWAYLDQDETPQDFIVRKFGYEPGQDGRAWSQAVGAKTAAATVTVYRGVSVEIEDYDNLPGSILNQATSGTGTNFQHGTPMSGAGAGVHWTTDKRVAQNFSAPMNRYAEPKTLHSDGWGVSVPVVFTAEVSSADVVTSAEELRDAMVEGHGWEGLPNPDRLPENEVLVRRGAQVRITSIEAVTPAAGWGRVRNAVENMEAGKINGWRCDWKRIGGGMTVTARQSYDLPAKADGPILRNWKGYSTESKQRILATYEDLVEGRIRPEPKQRPPLVGFWTAKINGADRIIVDDLPGGGWVLLGAVFEHNYDLAEQQIAGWLAWKKRTQGSLTKTADEDQCPYDASDSVMTEWGEYLCEDGHYWHPDEPAARAFHEGPGQIQPLASVPGLAIEEEWDLPSIGPGQRAVSARINGKLVGGLLWNTTDGIIDYVQVDADQRRKGIATLLLEAARRLDPNVRHDAEENRSETGKAWVRAVGSKTAASLPQGYTQTREVVLGDENDTFVLAYVPKMALGGLSAIWAGFKTVGGNLREYGHLTWRDGVIEDVYVDEVFRRQGLASAMLTWAREISPGLRHSTNLLPDGRAWSQSVGSKTAAQPGVFYHVTNYEHWPAIRPGDLHHYASRTAAKAYHYAPRSARDSIAQHGLDWRKSPAASAPRDPRNKAPVATYFSPDMGTALEMELGEDYDLYEVDISGLSTTPDPYQPEDAFYTLDPIPPSKVRRVTSAKTAGANGDLPPGTTFTYEERDGGGRVVAWNPAATGSHAQYGIGMISWNARGTITWVQAYEGWERRGLATRMLEEARKYRPDIKHSRDRSDDAKAWIKAVGSLGEVTAGAEEWFSTQSRPIFDQGPPRQTFSALSEHTYYRGLPVDLYADDPRVVALLRALAQGATSVARDRLIELMGGGSGIDRWSGNPNGPRPGAGGWWSSDDSMAWTYAFGNTYGERGEKITCPVVFEAHLDTSNSEPHIDGGSYAEVHHLEDGTPLRIVRMWADLPTQQQAARLLAVLEAQKVWWDIHGMVDMDVYQKPGLGNTYEVQERRYEWSFTMSTEAVGMTSPLSSIGRVR